MKKPQYPLLCYPWYKVNLYIKPIYDTRKLFAIYFNQKHVSGYLVFISFLLRSNISLVWHFVPIGELKKGRSTVFSLLLCKRAFKTPINMLHIMRRMDSTIITVISRLKTFFIENIVFSFVAFIKLLS